MHKLIVITHHLAVKEHELSSSLSIGRHESNQICLDEERASRQHCRVSLENGRATIEDLDSANGVFVNGARVRSCVLQHNDRIGIGKTTLVYLDERPAARGGDTLVLGEIPLAQGGDTVVLPVSALPAALKATSAPPVPVIEKPAAKFITPSPHHPLTSSPPRPKRPRKHPIIALLTLAAAMVLLGVALNILLQTLLAKSESSPPAARVEPPPPREPAAPAPETTPAQPHAVNYDFTNWRQQADWEPLSGSWLTKNGRFVLESTEGGELVLKEQALGGRFPLERAQLGFIVELRDLNPDFFFACDLGTAEAGVSIQFSAREIVLASKSGTIKSAPAAWKPGRVRVELTVDDDEASLTIDRKPAAKISIPRLSRVKGTVAFQARLCTCAFEEMWLRETK